MSNSNTNILAFIELYGHSEVLFGVCQLLQNTNYQIEIYTHQAIQEEAYLIDNQDNIKWIIQQKEQTIPQFLHSQQEQLERCETVFLLTVASDYRFFAHWKLATTQVLLVHNVNSFLQPRKAIKLPPFIPDFGVLPNWQTLKNIPRLFWFYLRNEAKLRQQIINNADYITFPNWRLTQHSQSFFKEKNKILPPLPYVFYQEKPPPVRRSSERVEIVIPGTVTAAGRDYQLLNQALQRALQHFERPVQLTFLGKIQDEMAEHHVETITYWENENFKVLAFIDSLPQRLYDNLLCNADFLILPLKKHLQIGIFQEEYGVSNISGGINDAIIRNKSVLISASYPIPKGLEKQFFTYKDATTLADYLVQFVNQKPTAGYQLPAKERYNYQLIQQDLLNFLALI